MITWKSALVLSFLVLATSAQYRDEQQQQQEGTQEQEGSLGGGNTLDPSVPEPPSQIPETSFVCDGKPYDPGMYADEETGCRVFHMCYQGRKESFICGTGTVFNQEILSCDYPDNVDCAASSQHYAANTELGKASSEPASGQAPAPRPVGQRPTQQEEFGGAEEPQYAARPSAPAPRPVAPPRPQVRPQAPRPKTAPRAPAPSRPAPAQRPPSKARPAPARPAQRPVQQQLGEQNLDYEPTQIIQRRVARQYPAPQESRAFQRRSNRRWSLMSERY